MAKGGTREIKTRIALDGEKEYKQACKSIDLSLKELGSEMKLVSETYKDNAKSTEALKSKQDVLNRQLVEQRKKVAETEAALKKMTESGLDPSSAAVVKMRTSLNNAKSELARTENQLNATTESLKKNGIEWDKVGEAAGKVGASLGKAMAALGAAAAGAATAMAAMTVSAGAYADELLTTSSQTHIATEDLQKYKYALNFIDGDLDTLTKTLRKNTQQMAAARDGNGALGGAYERLGISVTDANGELRDGETVYWEIIDALGKIENTTERDALAMELLGKSATELNPIIDAGSEAFKKLGKEAEEMGVVLGKDSLNKLGAFDDKVQQVKAGLGGLKNNAGLIALPFLDMLASRGVPILANFSKGLQEANGDLGKMGEVLGEGLSELVEMLVDNLPHFINFGVEIIDAIVSGIVENSGRTGDAITKIVSALAGGVTRVVPKLLDAGVKIVAGLADGLSKSVPRLIPEGVKMIKSIVKSLVDNIPMLIDAGLKLLLGLADGLLKGIPELVKELPTIITAIVDGLLESIPEIIDAGVQLLTALVDNLPLIIETIVEALPQIVTGIIKSLLKNIPKIVDAGVTLLVSLVQNIPEIILKIGAAIPEIISGIVEGIGEGVGDMFNAGVDLFLSLVEDVGHIVSEIGKKIPQLIQGVADKVVEQGTKIFEAGKELVIRLWNGILEMKDWLWQKAKDFAEEFGKFMKDTFLGRTTDGLRDAIRDAGNGYNKGHGGPVRQPGNVPLSEYVNQPSIMINQYINAENTSYSQQQKEAGRQAQDLLRGLYGR